MQTLNAALPRCRVPRSQSGYFVTVTDCPDSSVTFKTCAKLQLFCGKFGGLDFFSYLCN